METRSSRERVDRWRRDESAMLLDSEGAELVSEGM